MGPWRQVAASVVGTSHVRDGLPCQDASTCLVLRDDDRQEILVAVVSDGAGSGYRSDEGAALVCELLVSEIRDLIETGGDVASIDIEFARGWLTRLASEVEARAQAANVRSREFAATLLAAIVGADVAVFLQIGDGAIVHCSDEATNKFGIASWPQEGEYANTTWFATEPGAADRIELVRVEGVVNRVAILSDGLQRLALSFANRSAHSPFFRPLFAHLEGASEQEVDALRASLEDFLASAAVNARTDDDKSLVLASRRRIEAESLTGQ